MEQKDNFILAVLIIITISLTIMSLYIQHFYLNNLPRDSTTVLMDHINFFTSSFGLIAIIGLFIASIGLLLKYD